MSKVTRKTIILLLAALALSACGKHSHTPDDSEQPALIGFAPLSQDEMTKGEAEEFPHSNFGIWGIARKTGSTRNLWENAFTEVRRQGDSYVPVADEYWEAGYSYDFIALAPYDAVPINAETEKPDVTITPALNKMEFDFDMADRYEDADYAFDLMTAVAHTPEVEIASLQEPVDLTFWHLLAGVRINITFSGMENASVTGLRLRNVATERSYTITDVNDVLKATYATDTAGQTLQTITLDNTDDITANDLVTGKDSQNRDCQYKILHIIPQSIENLEMDMDFTIGSVATNNFKLNLEAAKYTTTDGVKEPVVYLHNHWYNWNISITPKGITFYVTVTPWAEATGDDSDFEFDFE